MKKTLLIIFAILIYFVLFLQIAADQRIAWRIKTGDFSLGGKTPAQAKEELQKKWDEFSNQEILFLYQDESWPIKLTDLGFEMNCQATIELACQIGHRPKFTASLKEQILAFLGYYRLEPIYQVNHEKFMEKTLEIFQDIEEPAQNATLIFNDETNDFSLVHSTIGTSVDRDKLLSDLSERVNLFSARPINLTVIDDSPTVENDEIDQAREKARIILSNQPYLLRFEDRHWTISQKILLDWIEFEPVKEEDSDNEILGLTLNQEEIENYIKFNVSPLIDRAYSNPRLKVEDGQAIEFNPGKDGFAVRKEETLNQLMENILSEPPVKETEIIADVSKPKITLSQINDLGINTLIGQGVSNFAGSPTNRKHNIKVGAEKFYGAILEPGEEFSFLALLGDSGPEAGFLPELVIKKNKTVPEYGGGLCQVSTTVFRAAINSGMKITFRRPHAFPVKYYNPQGFDATVYDPWPDLKFINNTPNHLLIETLVEDTYLTFNFYGTDDGRKIEIKGPYVLESNKDGSMKTTLYQTVYLNGKEIINQEFYSNYGSPNQYPVNPTEENKIETENQ